MPSTGAFVSAHTNRSMPVATVIPVLQYPDVAEAAAWLCHAFGFSERLRIGAHRIQMSAGDGAFVISAGPRDAKQQSTGPSVMVRVRSADEHYAIAEAAGAEILGLPQSQPYGERQYTARDLAGYVWTFSASEADIHPESWGGELVAAGDNAA
jgi:uncharacterized glyoxalase superfamily protein PhnB